MHGFYRVQKKNSHDYFTDLIVLIAATAVILLQPNHILSLYKYLSGAVLMLVMHFYTHDFINKSKSAEVDSTEAILFLIVLGLVGQLVIYLFEEKAWKRYISMVYHLPIIATYLQIHHTNTIYLFHLADGLVCSYLIYLAVNVLVTGVDKIKKQINRWIYLVNIFGYFPVTISIVGSIHITQQLLLFFFVSFTYKVYHFSTQTSDSDLVPLSQLDYTTFLFVIPWQCCKTYLGLLSMCVTLSYLSHYLFSLVNLYVFGWKSPVSASDFPSASIGVATFVLSIVTGIPMSLNTLEDFMGKGSDIHFFFMYSISNFIHSTYELVDPGILTFSAMPTSRPFKHFRGITMYISFIVLTIYTQYQIQQYDDVFIFKPLIIIGLSTCLQVMASIFIYLLFVYDGVSSNSVENLDDIIYYIRSAVQFLDCVGSAILAGRGIWTIN